MLCQSCLEKNLYIQYAIYIVIYQLSLINISLKNKDNNRIIINSNNYLLNKSFPKIMKIIFMSIWINKRYNWVHTRRNSICHKYKRYARIYYNFTELHQDHYKRITMNFQIFYNNTRNECDVEETSNYYKILCIVLSKQLKKIYSKGRWTERDSY